MAARQIHPRSLCRKWQSLLTKLKAKLAASNLLHILESFPPATSFAFYEATILHKKALKVNLGFRKQLAGQQATSWAYVLLERNHLDAPVVFRDEITTKSVDGDHSQFLPRAATSLLRKADGLVLPFRFLQFDPPENGGARGMLCALILYYTLANGLAESAIQWSAFEVSLVKALRYIADNEEYQQWRDSQFEGSNTTLKAVAMNSATNQRHATDMGERSIHSELSKRGGVVCSTGSSVAVKPGTTLAKLKEALGDKFKLINALPKTPVTIERQSVYPDYFPFRLHFGKYRGFDVYVYLTFDHRGTSKIIARDKEGRDWTWTFLNLEHLSLFEPFGFIMRLSSRDLSTRGNKIRYLVYYYFMLAENEGIIENPRIRGSFQSMIPSFCSACRDLEKTHDTTSRAGDQLQSVQEVDAEIQKRPPNDAPENVLVSCDNPTAKKPTMIVKLRLRPDTLAAILRHGPRSQHTEVLVGDNKHEEGGRISDETSHTQQILPKISSIPSTEVQRSFQQKSNDTEDATEQSMLDLENTNYDISPAYQPFENNFSRAGPGKSAFASSLGPSESKKAVLPVPSTQQQPLSSSYQINIAVAIDLPSDAEISMPSIQCKPETEGASKTDEAGLQRHSGDDDFPQATQRGLKRKVDYLISEEDDLKRKTAFSIGDEDDSCEEIDGSIWHQVLRRQPQLKGLQLHA